MTDASAKESQPKKDRLGLIAVVLALVGTLLACLPVVYIAGWVMLAAAGATGLAATLSARQSTPVGVVAIAVSVIGSVVAAAALVVLPESMDATPVTAQEVRAAPSPTSTFQLTPNTDGEHYILDGDEGSRSDPLPLNTMLSSPEWQLTVSNLVVNNSDSLVAAHPLLPRPRKGREYISVDVTITYLSDNPDYLNVPLLIYSDHWALKNRKLDGASVNSDNELYNPLSQAKTRSKTLIFSAPSKNAESGNIVVFDPTTKSPIYYSLK